MKRKILNSLLTFSIFFSSLVIPIQTIVERVKAAGVQTVTFNAVADTYITPSTYWDGNGGRRFIALGYFHDTTINAFNRWANGLIKFQNINLPQGAIVTEASLELWHYATATWGNGNGNYTFYVRRVTEGWSETTVWSGSETGDGGISATGDYGRFTFPDFDTIVSSNIQKRTINLNTNLINDLRTNPNNGIMIDTYGAYDGGAAVCSQDPDGWCTTAMIPKLHVKYVVNQKPDTPNPISPDNNTYINGNCDESVVPATGICRTQTSQDFQATVNDPDTLADMDMQGSKFYFSGANNFSSPEIAGDNWTTITYNALLNDGYTNWNVQSKDKQAALSNFSQTFNITTDTTPPEIPVLNGLAEWTPAVGLNETAQVTVTAPKVTDNVSSKEEVGYVLQYSKDSSFDPSVSEVFEYSSQYFSNPVDQSATFQIGPKGLDQIEGTSDDLVDGNTYYFRSKAHDKPEVSGEKNTSAWSSIVSTSIDGILPKISNYTVTDTRFSPNNATSVGIKDSITFSFDYIELNPKEAKIEIYSDEAGTNLVRTISIIPEVTSGQLSLPWDGKDNAGNYIADGPYVAFAIMTDLAGNRSYGNLDFNATNIPSEVIIVDNNEANISISSPFNNYWTNVLNIDITGQVKAPHDEGEEDQDLEQFRVTSSELSVDTDVAYDSLGLFNFNTDLNPGKNDFNFKSTDTVGNTGEKSLTIYTENIAPEISNVSPTGLTNNRKPTISFDVVDPNNNLDVSQVSNIPVGTNPKYMSVWLTFNSLDQNKNVIGNTKKLIENGVNLDPALVGDLTCTANIAILQRNNLDSAESAHCTLPFISDLQPDTTYKIHIQVSDIARNKALSGGKEFTLDSHIYSEVYTPVDQGIYSTSDILFTGKASRYSNLTISNGELGLTETIYVDEPTLINASSQLFVQDSLDLTCGEYIDTDNRLDTPDEEVCNWSVRVKQSYFNQDKDKSNVNIVFVSDEAGNSMSHTFNLIVNLYKFDLTVSSDYEYFSPNGDGRQDGLVFSHSATNPTDPINAPRIANYKIVIQESATGNKLVRELSGVDNLPAYTIFDGKWDDPSTPNNQFTWLPDGGYQYYLEVTTVDGAVVKTEPKTIFAKTELTDELFITSPQTGFVTTEGVVTVGGQAPTDQATDGTGVLRGDVKVLICVDTITPETPADCDGWYEVSADSNGFFSSIVVLPRIGSYDQTTHIVTAVAQDQFGNRTEESNAVSIILDTVDPFTSVSITPSLTGITSDADYERFLNGEISIDQIRTVKLTANVSQNTEQVQFALADFTNPLTGSPYYVKPANVDYNFIALVNNQTEGSTQLNPFSDPTIKANHEVQIGTNIPSNYCNQTNCSWSYYMPLYTGYSGTYEVEFTGKKGETIQSMTAGFRVDGSIQSAPIIMIVEKWDEDTDSWVKLDNVNLAHYTEGGKLRFRGAADPGTYLELVAKNADGTNVVLASVTVPETGVFEMIIDLDPLLKAPGNGNGQGNGLICREWKTGAGNEKKCVKGDFNFGLIGWEIDENGNPVNPVEGENGVEITYDEVLPEAESIVRTTEELAIDGWAKTGDQAKFLLTANEELQYADVLKEDGYQALMSNLSGLIIWAGVINIDRKSEGIYYPQIRLVDQSGNIQSYDSKLWETYGLGDFRIFIDNTTPDPTYIDKSEWSKTWEEGGINADGINPEKGRTNPEYVIKSDAITLKGKAEKNQRVELHITTGTPTSILGTTILNPLKKEVVYVPVTNQNCVGTGLNLSKDKVTQDGLVVKYAEVCDWSYTYTFKDDGSNEWDGVPNHGYTFQVRTIDKAANYSEFTKQEIVYHDKQAPIKPQIYEARSASYDPIVDWQVDGAGGRAITKDMSVTLKSYAERFADMQYTVISPKGNQLEQRYFINDTTTEIDQNFNLGGQTTDDKSGCTQMVNLRKVGICNDGLYSFNLRATDAAGNKSEILTNVKVERDTVAPNAPTINAEINGNQIYETLGLSISSEPGAIAIVNVKGAGIYRTLNIRLDSQGKYSTGNLIGTLKCGNNEYFVTVTIKDRAGNISDASYTSATTSECVVCGFTGGQLAMPIHDSRVVITSDFQTPERPDHDGIDFSIQGINPWRAPIYPVAAGTVIRAKHTGGVPGGSANYVTIRHDNGSITEYWHLDNELTSEIPVNVGQRVDTNTIIGHMGNTGNVYPLPKDTGNRYSGTHLHFELWVNGMPINPKPLLGIGSEFVCEVETEVGELGFGNIEILSDEDLADEIIDDLKLEEEPLENLIFSWSIDPDEIGNGYKTNTNQFETEEGEKFELEIPEIQTGKKDAIIGKLTILNFTEKSFDLQARYSDGHLISGDISFYPGTIDFGNRSYNDIYRDFYLEDIHTGAKYSFSDCDSYPNPIFGRVGECFMVQEDTIGIGKNAIVSEYLLRGTLLRNREEQIFSDYVTPEKGEYSAITFDPAPPFDEDYSTGVLYFQFGDHADEVDDKYYWFGDSGVFELLPDVVCVLGGIYFTVQSGGMGTPAAIKGAALCIGMTGAKILNDGEFKAEHAIEIGTELVFFGVGRMLTKGVFNKPIKYLTSKITAAGTKSNIIRVTTQRFFERNLARMTDNQVAIYIKNIGKGFLKASDDEALEKLSQHVIRGQFRENAELTVRGLTKNKSLFRPVAADFDSSLWKKVMGENFDNIAKLPLTPKNGLVKGVIIDSSTNAVMYEIKDVSTLSLTYQIRLELYQAMKAGKKMIIITNKNTQITEPLKNFIKEFDIGVEFFVSK